MIMHAAEILRRRGLLTPQQLEQSRNGDPSSIVDNAVSLGYVSAREALTAIADEVGLEFIDLDAFGLNLFLKRFKFLHAGILFDGFRLGRRRSFWIFGYGGGISDFGMGFLKGRRRDTAA